MRIETFNSQKEQTSSKEIKIKVPKYIQEFDDSKPIVNITGKEYKLLKSRKGKLERDFLIEKLKYYIKYDYSLFQESEKCSLIDFILEYNLSMDANHPKVLGNVKLENKTWLCSLLNKAMTQVENEKWPSQKQSLWLQYVKSESDMSWSSYYSHNHVGTDSLTNSEDEGVDYRPEEDIVFESAKRYRSLLNVFHQDYSSELKRNPKLLSRIEHTASFLPKTYTSHLTSILFDDNEFVASVAIKLFEIHEKQRSDIYGIIYAYDFFTGKIIGSSHAYVTRIISPEYSFKFDAKGNKVDIILSSEEKAYARVSTNQRIIINAIRECLNREYEDYTSKEKDYIEQQVEGQLYDKTGCFRKNANHKIWETFYRNYREEFLRESKNSLPDTPAFYYNLLLRNHDNPDSAFEFNDRFIVDLLFVCDKLKGVRLNEIFDNVYSLNYIKANVGILEDTSDPFIIIKGGVEYNTVDDVVSRIIDFLQPILGNKEYVEDNWLKKDSKHDFVKKLKTLFEPLDDKNIESVNYLRNEIKKNGPYDPKTKTGFDQGFDIRLLWNILGALHTIKENTTRIFRARSGSSIVKALCDKRGIEKTGSYRNYINRYNKYGTSDSKLSKEITSYIQKHFEVSQD